MPVSLGGSAGLTDLLAGLGGIGGSGIRDDGGGVIASGEDLFNVLMGAIEPELTTERLEEAKRRARGETEVQRITRLRRYAKAFTAYTKLFASFADAFRDSARTYERQRRAALEMQSKGTDDQHMEELRSDIEHS